MLKKLFKVTCVCLLLPVLGACGSPFSSRYAADENLPPHLQATEGRLFTRQGEIKEQRGRYYLSSLGGQPLFGIDRQSYAAQFVNKPVNVTGFFNYDQGSVNVTKITPIRNK